MFTITEELCYKRSAHKSSVESLSQNTIYFISRHEFSLLSGQHTVRSEIPRVSRFAQAEF
jgi:hypothetical protein